MADRSPDRIYAICHCARLIEWPFAYGPNSKWFHCFNYSTKVLSTDPDHPQPRCDGAYPMKVAPRRPRA